MVSCKYFYQSLLDRGISYFTGVPDSLLKDICAYITDHTPADRNIIAANEGGAIALACGYHLASGQIGLVYMQNAGLGNAVNPLVSLLDREVYNIPTLIIVGWRGEPGNKDEPQHVKQGRITQQLIATLEIPYRILPDTDEEAEQALDEAVDEIRRTNNPYVLLVRKGTFNKYVQQNSSEELFPLTREGALQVILEGISDASVIVSTTGQASREIFEYRTAHHQGHQKDFLTVGSMGHASQIALGIAIAKPAKKIYCIDGDGAVIMHMGALAIIGNYQPENFRHIVINNGAHDSVGGQPTAGFNIDIPKIAKACGYKIIYTAATTEEVIAGLAKLDSSKGPSILEIKVMCGAREDLGRPTTTPIENKTALMKYLQAT